MSECASPLSLTELLGVQFMVSIKVGKFLKRPFSAHLSHRLLSHVRYVFTTDSGFILPQFSLQFLLVRLPVPSPLCLSHLRQSSRGELALQVRVLRLWTRSTDTRLSESSYKCINVYLSMLYTTCVRLRAHLYVGIGIHTHTHTHVKLKPLTIA